MTPDSPTTRAADPGRALRRGRPDSLSGLQLFARYAYPPNELGYCGPDDHRALFDYGTEGVTDPGLVQLAKGFQGPWPYLTLVAGAAGIDDPFDRRVVEAYWVGNDLLDRVDLHDFGAAIRDRFRSRAGRHWGHLAEAIPAGAVAHHSFHVFGVYPYVGLLASGRVDEPLHQLDRCRIRWGKVVAVRGDEVDVRYRPLDWEGTRLVLGRPEVETLVRAIHGSAFVADLQPGQWVSAHWHWVCDRLDRRQLANLRGYTRRQLAITNDRVAHSGPGLAMSGGR